MAYEIDRDELWSRIPGIEFADFDQLQHIETLFNGFLDDVQYDRIRPQDSAEWQDLIDFLGLDEADFPWESFREWYEGVA
jgi:hypothetical protein